MCHALIAGIAVVVLTVWSYVLVVNIVVVVVVLAVVQWERIVVFVLAVVGGVLMLHLLIEVLNSRYKAWKRKHLLNSSPSNNVQFSSNGGGSIAADWLEAQSEDFSDTEETSNLIPSFKADAGNVANFTQSSIAGRTGYDGNHGVLNGQPSSGREYLQQQVHEEGRRVTSGSCDAGSRATGTSGGDTPPGDESFVEDLVVVDSGHLSSTVGVALGSNTCLPVDRGGREGDGWSSVELAVDPSKT